MKNIPDQVKHVYSNVNSLTSREKIVANSVNIMKTNVLKLGSMSPNQEGVFSPKYAEMWRQLKTRRIVI